MAGCPNPRNPAQILPMGTQMCYGGDWRKCTVNGWVSLGTECFTEGLIDLPHVPPAPEAALPEA